MIYNPTVQLYEDYLVSTVWHNDSFRGPRYHQLFSFLFNTPFVPSIELDQPRANDAVDLRYAYADQYHIPYEIIDRDLGGQNSSCSMLEMMVALSIRMENHIMEDKDLGNRTGQWFWSMVVSLGLDGMDDTNFDSAKAAGIIHRFNTRQYEPCGKGGLFTVQNPTIDMRGMDIWYQMQHWIGENYIGKV